MLSITALRGAAPLFVLAGLCAAISCSEDVPRPAPLRDASQLSTRAAAEPPVDVRRGPAQDLDDDQINSGNLEDELDSMESDISLSR